MKRLLDKQYDICKKNTFDFILTKRIKSILLKYIYYCCVNIFGAKIPSPLTLGTRSLSQCDSRVAGGAIPRKGASADHLICLPLDLPNWKLACERAADGLAAACLLLRPGTRRREPALHFYWETRPAFAWEKTSASIKGAKRSRGEPAQQSIDLLEREQVA